MLPLRLGFFNRAGQLFFNQVLRLFPHCKENWVWFSNKSYAGIQRGFLGKKKKDIGFLFTNEIIPTWWTQLPSSYPLLTGWAGGPPAWTLENKDDETILELALRSLANVFQKTVDELKQMLTASAVANWKNDPYSNGAYSYDTVGSMNARKLLNTPVGETIFFAGEALYQGPSFGTVEAALVSAKDVIEKIVSGE